MRKSLVESYADELEFLIALKQSIGILHNRIHDKLAYIAIEKLSNRHPNLSLKYLGAGVKGIDVQGFTASGSLRLVAEVKATHTTETVKLRPPQKMQIEKDLKRLAAAKGNVVRYLIVISAQTKAAVEKQLKTEERFPTVEVMNGLGQVALPPTDEPVEQFRRKSKRSTSKFDRR